MPTTDWKLHLEVKLDENAEWDSQCDQMLKSKVAQNFPIVTQKEPTAVFTKKECFIKMARKSLNI